MAVTMYSGFVPVCLQLLGGLKTVLQKAEEHATAQKWDTTVVLNLRLFPDMFPLERQVRQVCTHSCGAGRVAGWGYAAGYFAFIRTFFRVRLGARATGSLIGCPLGGYGTRKDTQ